MDDYVNKHVYFSSGRTRAFAIVTFDTQKRNLLKNLAHLYTHYCMHEYCSLKIDIDIFWVSLWPLER